MLKLKMLNCVFRCTNLHRCLLCCTARVYIKTCGLVRPKDMTFHMKNQFSILYNSPFFFLQILKFEKLAQEMRCLLAKQFNQYKAFTQGIMLLMYDLTCFMYYT